jgi:hypothetical protein
VSLPVLHPQSTPSNRPEPQAKFVLVSAFADEVQSDA